MMDPGSSNRGMMKSKQAKASEDGVDMISNLPDPILHLILSRLPTTDEVTRTSILSTRWRYLWTSVPFVDLDYSRGLKPFKEIEKEKFKEFADWVLVSKSFNLDSFRLCCSDLYSMSTVSRWIYAAVTRNIKSLHLEFHPTEDSEDIELPRCLVTCGSLAVLRLISFFGRRLILPKFTWLSALRVLELNDVELFNDDLVNDFFKSCPLLEELSLIDCVFDKLNELCISCPNLESLRIVNQEQFGAVGEDFCRALKIFCPKLVFFEFGADIAVRYSFESLGSLKKVVIHLEEFPPDSMVKVLCELLVGSSLVEILSTSCHICCGICSLFVSQYKNADVPVFLPNLKTLELTMDFDEDHIDSLYQILACFPHLESLQLIIEASYHGVDVSELEEAETMRILTSHLKRVEFELSFNCKWSTLHTAELILEHANALEEMVFRLDCDEVNFHKMSTETMKEVSHFQKASPTVKLVTLQKKK